jgi:hypothetical protein
MLKSIGVLVLVTMALLLSGCLSKPVPSFKGIPIAKLYEAMPATRVVLLNGNYRHDTPFFNAAYPTYLSLKTDAINEDSTVLLIRADNYYRDQDTVVKALGVDEYWEFLRINSVMARSTQTERNLEIGFCKDPSSVDTGHNYFYCFGYKDSIYKVITKVDVLDRDTGRIKRAWVYMPYKAGRFVDFFVPGPYGILPKPAITGRNYEPRVFID